MSRPSLGVRIERVLQIEVSGVDPIIMVAVDSYQTVANGKECTETGGYRRHVP
jgi:hypothetical protein